jgi:hypothetical protein
MSCLQASKRVHESGRWTCFLLGVASRLSENERTFVWLNLPTSTSYKLHCLLSPSWCFCGLKQLYVGTLSVCARIVHLCAVYLYAVHLCAVHLCAVHFMTANFPQVFSQRGILLQEQTFFDEANFLSTYRWFLNDPSACCQFAAGAWIWRVCTRLSSNICPLFKIDIKMSVINRHL